MAACTTTTTTTTINPAAYACEMGCPREFDAECIDYTGDDLDNIDVGTDDTLDEIIVALDGVEIEQTTFIANSTSSIKSTVGGTRGHAPVYEVRINPAEDNLIEVSEDGLYVNPEGESDGMVMVDENDTKQYLESKFVSGTDGVLSLFPVKSDGKIQVVPHLNVEALVELIESDFLTEFCSAFGSCGPGQE